ncbi:MAG: hypothetical protein LBF88_09190 [Planctomycetaceae bacterium]|nr:hypothetical protein [Planctomycetaceae bacterium]
MPNYLQDGRRCFAETLRWRTRRLDPCGRQEFKKNNQPLRSFGERSPA